MKLADLLFGTDPPAAASVVSLVPGVQLANYLPAGIAVEQLEESAEPDYLVALLRVGSPAELRALDAHAEALSGTTAIALLFATDLTTIDVAATLAWIHGHGLVAQRVGPLGYHVFRSGCLLMRDEAPHVRDLSGAPIVAIDKAAAPLLNEWMFSREVDRALRARVRRQDAELAELRPMALEADRLRERYQATRRELDRTKSQSDIIVAEADRRASVADIERQRIEASTSFRVGRVLVHTRTAKDALHLPRNLVNAWRDRGAWRSVTSSKNTSSAAGEPTGSPDARLTAAFRSLPDLTTQVSVTGLLTPRTVAALCDSAIAAVALAPHDAKELLARFQPSIFVIESSAALAGSTWASVSLPEGGVQFRLLDALIEQMSRQGVPTVFWYTCPRHAVPGLDPIAVKCDAVVGAPGRTDTGLAPFELTFDLAHAPVTSQPRSAPPLLLTTERMPCPAWYSKLVELRPDLVALHDLHAVDQPRQFPVGVERFDPAHPARQIGRAPWVALDDPTSGAPPATMLTALLAGTPVVTAAGPMLRPPLGDGALIHLDDVGPAPWAPRPVPAVTSRELARTAWSSWTASAYLGAMLDRLGVPYHALQLARTVDVAVTAGADALPWTQIADDLVMQQDVNVRLRIDDPSAVPAGIAGRLAEASIDIVDARRPGAGYEVPWQPGWGPTTTVDFVVAAKRTGAGVLHDAEGRVLIAARGRGLERPVIVDIDSMWGEVSA